MAPLGMVDMLGGFSSPELGIISLVVFLILSISLAALCATCNRKSGNAYDVNGTKSDGAGGINGTVDTKTADFPDSGGSSTWKGHTLPPSTLERNHDRRTTTTK